MSSSLSFVQITKNMRTIFYAQMFFVIPRIHIEIPTLKFPRNCMQVQTWPQIKSISTLGSLKFLSKFQSQIRRFVQVFVFYILIFGQFQFSWKCSPKALRKNDTNHRLLQNIHEKSIHFLNDMLSNLRGWSEAKAYAGRRSRKIL